MPETTQIDRTSVVNDVLRRYPATVSVFNYFGVDVCCGGAATIAEAAENEIVDTEALVDALRGTARHAGRTRSMTDAAHPDAPCGRAEVQVAPATVSPASSVVTTSRINTDVPVGNALTPNAGATRFVGDS